MKYNFCTQKHFLIACIVIFGFFTSGCEVEVEKNEKQAPSTDMMIADANKVDSLYAVHFNNGDLDALMSLHWNSPEFISYPVGEMKLKGYDAVKEIYRKDFENYKGARMEYVEYYNVPVEGAVMGHGVFKWTYAPEGAPVEEFIGRYSDVKAYKDGKMVILLDHSSLPTPAEAPVDSTGVE